MYTRFFICVHTENFAGFGNKRFSFVSDSAKIYNFFPGFQISTEVSFVTYYNRILLLLLLCIFQFS